MFINVLEFTLKLIHDKKNISGEHKAEKILKMCFHCEIANK